MKKFAKLFESEEYGQIVVIRQNNDDGEPEVRFFLRPKIDGLRVCAVAAAGKDDSEESEKAMDAIFDKTDLQAAEEMASTVNDELTAMLKTETTS